MVHAKDMTKGGEMVDVGRGAIDFGAIFRHSEQAGLKHIFVEHDEPTAPLDDARISYTYLRQLTY
jgi:sugar phosphate isomerase/epimerase